MFVKNLILAKFCYKFKYLIKNRIYGKVKFMVTKIDFWSNFGQKSKFWSKIEILVENFYIFVQCSLFWACSDYDEVESCSSHPKEERVEMDSKIAQKSMSLSPIEAPIKDSNTETRAESLGLTGLPALLQDALKRQQNLPPNLPPSDRQNSPSPKSEMEEVFNKRKIQDVISQITAQTNNSERPNKIR